MDDDYGLCHPGQGVCVGYSPSFGVGLTERVGTRHRLRDGEPFRYAGLKTRHGVTERGGWVSMPGVRSMTVTEIDKGLEDYSPEVDRVGMTGPGCDGPGPLVSGSGQYR